MRKAAAWRLLALAGASCVAVAGALAGVPVQTVPAAGGSGVANGQVAVTAGDTGNGLGTDVAQMPYGLAVAANGEIYVSDFSDPAAVEPDPAQPGNATGDSVIRVLDPATDTEQVVAGDGDGASQTVAHGKQSVAATDSSLDDPAGMAIDPTNESLVFDEPWLQVATRYTPPSGTDPGTVSEVCSTDGAGTAAGGDAAVDSNGNVVIPIIGGTGVEVWAAQTGTFWGKAMTAGKTYAIPTPYSDPWAVAIDPHDNLLVSSSGDSLDVLAGSTGTYYDQAMTVGNWYHLAGQPTTNSGDAGFGGDGGPATSALIGAPHGISLDVNGNILLADTDNNRIRVIAQSTGTFYGVDMTAGDIYTVAGSGTAPSPAGTFGGDGGAATSAGLNQPTAVVADQSGNLVVADNGNLRVRVVAESTGTFYGLPMTQNDIYTVAGNGWSSYSGDGGSATSAQLGKPEDVSFDSAGNELIADSANGRIRVVAGTTGTFYDTSMTAGDIYTVAGEVGAVEADLGDGGPATAAELNEPGSVRSDGDGNLLIADTGDNQIRVVAGTTGTQYGVAMTRGDIYTIAGNGTQGSSGDNGAATSAELDGPQSAILDRYGNVVIADTGNNRVRVVAESTGTFYDIAMTQGDIYTVAGTGTAGYNGDATTATGAELDAPVGLALDQTGNIVVADSKNDRVRVISAGTSTDFGAPMTDGGIVTIMGGGTRQTEGSTPLNVDLSPDRVAVDGRGDLVVSDDGSERIWVLAGKSGTLWGQSMTAGDAYSVAGGNTSCASYTASGAATSAYLCDPAGVVVDPTGDIDVASPEINRIFTIGNALAVTTTSLPGGTVGTSYSEGLTAVGGPTPFDWTITTGALPPGLDLNSAGTISGTPTAGGLYSFTVEATDSDSPAQSATQALSIAVRPYATSIITTAAGNGDATSTTSTGGSSPTATGVGQPYAVTVDQAGNTVFTDVSDNEVDVVAASSGTFYGIAMTAGDVYTVAGGGTSTTAGGPGATFAFNFPDGLVSDSAGNLVIADGGASQILVLANTDGTDFGQDMTAGDLYLVAGTGAQGMSGMGGPATSAVLGFPSGLAEDQAGNLLVADFSDNAVFAIAGTSGTYYGQSMTGGDIYTIADSSGVEGDTGDGGAATSATLDSPSDVAVDSVGNVLIADTFNNAIRVIAASSGTYYGQSMTAGDIYTLAGLGPDDNGFGGDDGPAGLAELNEPGWVALDDFGNVYVADTGNNRVRMIAASTGTYYGISMTAGDIYTVAGTGTAGYSGDAGPSGLAELNGPNGVAVTSGGSGTLLITDSSNFRVRAVSGGLPVAKVPAAPSGLVATAGDGQVVLQWNPSTGAASYSAFMASAPGAEQTSSVPVCTTNASSTTCTAADLTNGQTYYFEVTATNGIGSSGPSNEAQATPAS